MASMPVDVAARRGTLSPRESSHTASPFSPIMSFGTRDVTGAAMPSTHPLPTGQNIYETPCPILYAMELIGQKWKLPIL